MSVDNHAVTAEKLLIWYDREGRSLPWRARPGETAPDPYAVWLSEVMLQQTTVAAVRPYHAKFLALWPDVAALAAAEEADVMAAWAGLGYYARARNLIACAKAVTDDQGGTFPDNEAGLRALPGIGAYTAAAIAAIAFGRRAVVVDANVERVITRLFALEEALPGARKTIYDLTDRLTPDLRAGDFAQAMMDLGATVCTTRKPNCLLCPIASDCAASQSDTPERFPIKAAKAVRPHKYGTAYWIIRKGTVLLVRRPDKGMLGGMRALPTGPWAMQDPGLAGAPFPANWQNVGSVAHIFTHFSLDIMVVMARSPTIFEMDGEWWPIEDIERAGLPTLFARAAERAIAAMTEER